MTTTRNFPRRQGGFSIVELMIGVALGLVILAALTSFFVSTSANRHEIERTSRQIENGRYAIDTVRSTLRVSAFYAEMQQAGAQITNSDPCKPLLADVSAAFKPSPLYIPIAVYGYAADSPSFPSCITDRLADTDVLVMRRFNTEMISTTTAATPDYANQLFVQMSRCATDSLTTPWVLDYGSSTGNFLLKNTSCNGPTDLYQYRVEIYYVRTYSETAGDNIPTLVRLDLNNRTMRTSPIVEGIRAFRVSYGLDNVLPRDGSPDEWRRCDTVTTCGTCNFDDGTFCNGTQWPNVTMLRVSILAENLEDSPNFVDNRTYDIDGYSPTVFNDHRKRHVYSTMVSLPNRTGPLEN